MALNCSMLSPNNQPIPLPGEKIFLSVEAVSISLTPTPPGSGTTNESQLSPSQESSKKGKLSMNSMLSAIHSGSTADGTATGTIYVTNQRILFVANNASSLPEIPPNQASEVAPSTLIRTLTVPLANSFDGRFIQPWLSANYHLSTVIPVPGGNLNQLLPSTSAGTNPVSTRDSFTLKVVFNQGHGFEFHEALEEVKNIMFENDGRRPAQLEELPSYSPPIHNPPLPFTGTVLPGAPQAADPSSLPCPAFTAEASVGESSFQRRDTMPADDLLLAAQVATEEEFQERDLITEEPPPTSETTPLSPTDHPDHSTPNRGAPPTYEP